MTKNTRIIILFTVCVFIYIPTYFAAKNNLQQSANIEGRIINGTLASFNETKHQVSIRERLADEKLFGAGHHCGGSLIRSDVVLTAAHCFLDEDRYDGSFLPKEDFIIVMGNLNRYERNNYTLVFDIKEIVYNVTVFNIATIESDIAVVFLNDSIPTNYTRADVISLNTVAVEDGTICQVTGWGLTENGTLADDLRTVDVPIIDFDVCANEMNYTQGMLREGMLCAGYIEGERDACGGDSGGPLVCNQTLAGIVSWGSGCAQPYLPGVYTNVSYWSEWIESKLNGARSYGRVSGYLIFIVAFCIVVMNI